MPKPIPRPTNKMTELIPQMIPNIVRKLRSFVAHRAEIVCLKISKMGMVEGCRKCLGFEQIRMRADVGSSQIHVGLERDTIKEVFNARMVKSADTADLKSYKFTDIWEINIR
jgi:hypothetical protein